MTDKTKITLDAHLKLIEIASQMACASVGNSSNYEINKVFEKCYESILVQLNVASLKTEHQ